MFRSYMALPPVYGPHPLLSIVHEFKLLPPVMPRRRRPRVVSWRWAATGEALAAGGWWHPGEAWRGTTALSRRREGELAGRRREGHAARWRDRGHVVRAGREGWHGGGATAAWRSWRIMSGFPFGLQGEGKRTRGTLRHLAGRGTWHARERRRRT